MTKRDEDSSLMQLKEEFRTYEALRREHDSQIVQIAMEGGLRIAPDQWSSLLYGDQSHKSHMQSIIDKVCERSNCFLACVCVASFWKKKIKKMLLRKTLIAMNLPKHLLFFASGIAADPSVFCSECSGADDCAAEDRRSSQSQPPAAPPGTVGQY